MNILNKVTRRSLMRNRVRTVVTVIGIILSAAMISAVTTSISSFMGYLQKGAVYSEGLWHGSFTDMPAEDRTRLEADKNFDSAAYAQIVGWAAYDEGTNPTMYDVPYLYVIGGDEAFYERMPVRLTEGRLPESPDELVIYKDSQYCAVFGGEPPAVGDSVTLNLGERRCDGSPLNRYDSYESGEELLVREQRTYTVVGLCERPSFDFYNNPSFIAFTAYDDADSELSLESFFLLKNPKNIYSFLPDFSGDAYPYSDNRDYLMTLGYSWYDTFFRVLYSIGAILIGLIMFGSVSLIYNAFSISVSERTKQFGLLRSIGATKRQIRHMVLYEAALVSAVGIPLGILSGILGMTVTFRFIGDDLASLYSNSNGAVAFTMHVTPTAIIAAAVIGFITVLISAWVPSRRAMRISAIEAIRQSTDVSIKRREVRVSPVTRKLFGLEGTIASKNFKRARKRYRATVVSLFMSVVLFISTSSFCRYMTDSVSRAYLDYDYDLRYTAAMSNVSENDYRYAFDLMRDAEGVTKCSAARVEITDAVVDSKYYIPSGDDAPDAWRVNAVRFVGLDDDTYREFLKENGLDESVYMGRNAKLVVNSYCLYFNADTQRLEKTKLLSDDMSSLTANVLDFDAYSVLQEQGGLTNEEYSTGLEACYDDVELPVGCQVDNSPFGFNSNRNDVIHVFMPMERFEAIFGRTSEIQLYFASSDHRASFEALSTIAGGDETLLSSGFLRDIRENSELEKSIVTIVKVVSYGFITLISFIAAANVFNTISTNVFLRRREFAMLRSVGMTNRGFNKMMNYECILYGVKSLIFGIPAAFGVTYLIFRSVREGMDIGFYLPWGAVAIAVGSVFLVVFVTMLYAMSSVKRDNPIETLRNEAI